MIFFQNDPIPSRLPEFFSITTSDDCEDQHDGSTVTVCAINLESSSAQHRQPVGPQRQSCETVLLTKKMKNRPLLLPDKWRRIAVHPELPFASIGKRKSFWIVASSIRQPRSCSRVERLGMRVTVSKTTPLGKNRFPTWHGIM